MSTLSNQIEPRVEIALGGMLMAAGWNLNSPSETWAVHRYPLPPKEASGAWGKETWITALLTDSGTPRTLDHTFTARGVLGPVDLPRNLQAPKAILPRRPVARGLAPLLPDRGILRAIAAS